MLRELVTQPHCCNFLAIKYVLTTLIFYFCFTKRSSFKMSISLG